MVELLMSFGEVFDKGEEKRNVRFERRWKVDIRSWWYESWFGENKEES